MKTHPITITQIEIDACSSVTDQKQSTNVRPLELSELLSVSGGEIVVNAHQFHELVSLFLLQIELADLTGSARPSSQIRWLAKNGWRFAIDIDGKPRVAREYFHQRLCSVMSSTEKTAVTPRWDVLVPSPNLTQH